MLKTKPIDLNFLSEFSSMYLELCLCDTTAILSDRKMSSYDHHFAFYVFLKLLFGLYFPLYIDELYSIMILVYFGQKDPKLQ